jgi:hypothetical protein
MRTTLNLEDDVLRVVRSLSQESGKSLGAVVSELVRRALRPTGGATYESGFPVFEVREGTPPITPEMVRSALEDD